ncbi:MAG: hypothetical protein ACPGYV_13855, partial [Phycisphaeraceae bacterium]
TGFFFVVVARFAMAGSVSEVASRRAVAGGSQREVARKTVGGLGRRGVMGSLYCGVTDCIYYSESNALP